MKGLTFPEDLGMTLIQMVITVGLLTVLLLLYIGMQFHLYSGSPISFSVDFVSVVNKPYMLGGVLEYTKLDDRQILEQAIEGVGTDSLENANAGKLLDRVENFVRTYDLKYYKITLINESGTMAYTDNAGQRCGEKTDGWCVNKNTGCDVGRIEIEAKNLCGANEVCCRQDLTAYQAQGNRRGKYVLVRCGENKGICSEGETKNAIEVNLFTRFYVSLSPLCGGGQTEIDVKDCKTANNGKTKICCIEKIGADLTTVGTDIGPVNKVSIPLFYKNRAGYLEVEVK